MTSYDIIKEIRKLWKTNETIVVTLTELSGDLTLYFDIHFPDSNYTISLGISSEDLLRSVSDFSETFLIPSLEQSQVWKENNPS